MRFIETASDATIGFALIVVSFLILGLCAVPLYGILWLLSKTADFVTTRTGFPSDAWYPAFVCVAALACSVKALRKRYWLSLLLSLAVVPMTAAAWLKGGLAPHNSLWIVPLWFLIAIPDFRRIPLFQFVSGLVLIAVSFFLSIESSHTSWGRAADDVFLLAIYAWLYFYFFRDQLKPQADSTPASPQ